MITNASELTSTPIIILVEPQMGENIGMVARAMANFGLRELRLVNPRDGWPNEKAVAAASKADHVIEATKVFDTLEEALADTQYVLATTARQRDGFKPVHGPEAACRQVATRVDQRCAILFGRERWGLTNEEVARADAIVTFPVDPDFTSLNIAQAVLLVSYEWRRAEQQGEKLPFVGPETLPAQKHELYGMFDQLEDALDRRGYFRPETKKAKLIDNMRAVLTRPGFTSAEISLLRGLINSLDRFSPEQPKGRREED
ncbi:RNA methyltransferase [Limoniibacter endophyticus]|uniref:tRNA (cytidine/uridine-2'-O-)-methyltransferase TrmJ n=1 Tax=Limoniibacter endophyticus TaxID=1565040 RepID=A0A8J3GF61_9HYPH|nr:RNA methyltransferase [Limoniibacter endophyticus]GHC60583.1 tRNA (cytidine/uridine-2'-O-)-methyltransferase TrmJ [Limoniibacter endophyticus]